MATTSNTRVGANALTSTTKALKTLSSFSTPKKNDTVITTNKNNGSGIKYLGHKFGLGFLSTIEGIWDYTAGGVAKAFGETFNNESAVKWAEKTFDNDWTNYNAADEWFNPSEGWKFAGDVASGLGTSSTAMLSAGIAAGIIALTGGAGTPLAASMILGSTSALTAGLGAAGNATKEAYRETGKLDADAFGYGALSGATEAALEFATGMAGKGSGKLIDILSKKLAKDSAKSIAKRGALTVLKDVGGDFLSEAIEEGVAEWLTPYWKRATYDPNATNATWAEIGYSSLVGGISGMVMGGGTSAVNTGISHTSNIVRGKKSHDSGTYKSIMDIGRRYADIESANSTGIASYENAQNTYNRLVESLKKHNDITSDAELQTRLETGDLAFKANDLMLLGQLSTNNAAATIHSEVEKYAERLIYDADNMAAKFSSFGMKDASGKPINITADQLLEGVDKTLLEKVKSGEELSTSERKTFVKSLRKAMTTNSTLVTLAASEVAGEIMTDTKKMTESILSGEQMASMADINRLLREGKTEEIEELGRALGISDWSTVSSRELATKLSAYNESGGMSEWASQQRRMREAASIGIEQSKQLPHVLKKNMEDGAYRFASGDGNVDMAVIKEGEVYHLYNYETGDISRAMTTKEINSILKTYWTKGKIDTTEAVETTPSKYAEQEAKIDEMATKDVEGYKSLSADSKASVRATMRQAQAHGLTEIQTKIIAAVAAKSGINIEFDATMKKGEDGIMVGNTLYINPNNSEQHTYEMILGHEMFHEIFKNGEKNEIQLFTEARNIIGSESETAKSIRERYKKYYKKHSGNKMSNAEITAISEEEVAAAGSEEVFKSEKAWEYMLSKEPTLGDKVLNFFRRSAREYSELEGLSKEARRFARHYKKLFNELSERNRGNNAFGGVTFESAEEAKLSGEEEENKRYSFAGRKAKTADEYKLSTAEKMLNDGIDAKTVRKETGWFKGYDGKWRFEIDDSQMKITVPTNKYPTVEQIVSHPKLFEAYPHLKDIFVTVHNIQSGKGSYSRVFGDIEISQDLINNPESLRSVIAHELQHAIQDYEGFAGGASLEFWEKRLAEGYDSRQDYVKAEEKALLDRIKQMRLDDANNDTNFVSDMEELIKMTPDHPRGKIDWDTLEQIEEDSPQWKSFDKERDTLSKIYGESAVFNFLTIESRLKQLKTKGNRFASDLYLQTAGEIEARDVQKRLHLDETQRKDIRPDIDQEDVVFAERSDTMQSISVTTDGRKVVVVNDDVLRNVHGRTQEIAVVKKALGRFKRVPVHKQSIYITGDTANEVTRSKNTETLRKKDTVTYKDKMRVMNHPVDVVMATTDYVNEAPKHPRKDDIVDFARGTILLQVHGRQYSAEVVYGYTKKGVCRLHDIVQIQPATFAIKKSSESLSLDRESAEYRRNEPFDTNSITENSEKSNPSDENSSKNSASDNEYLSAVESGDTATQERIIEARAREAGYNTPMLYHGTTSFGFTEFDRGMSYDQISIFSSDDREVAKIYADNDPRTKISERADITPEALESASNEKILSYLKEYVSDRFKIVSTEDYTDAAHKLISDSHSLLEDFVKSKKLTDKESSIFSDMLKSLDKLRTANNYDTMNDAYNKYERSMWDLKWANNTLIGEVRPLIVNNLRSAYITLSSSLENNSVAFKDGNNYITRKQAITKLYPKLFSGIYKLYGKTENPLRIDGHGQKWNELDGKRIGVNGKVNTRDVVKYASLHGYDSVIFKDIIDADDSSPDIISNVYAFLKDGLVKSADLITYDDNGNIIPPSQRFNSNVSDIRYALSDEFDVAKGSVEFVQNKTKPTRSLGDKIIATETSVEIHLTNVHAGIERAGRALGMKNIEALVQRCRASATAAQEMIGGAQWKIIPNATKTEVVKLGDGLEPILAQVRDVRKGETKEEAQKRYEDFQYYLYHMHNIDRMSLEERSIAENDANIQLREKYEKAKESLLRKINNLKKLKERIKGKRDAQSKDERQRIATEMFDAKTKLSAVEEKLSELNKEIENFVVEKNKPVLRKQSAENPGEYEEVTADESREIVNKYAEKYPEFQGTSQKVYTFLDNLLKMQVDFGLIDRETYDYLRNKYPHYVPTYRTATPVGIKPVRGAGNIEVSKIVKTATGSFETLDDLELSIARLTQKVLTLGNVNILANQLFSAAEKNNSTTFIEEVSRKRNKKDNIYENESDEPQKKNQISFYRDGERITARVTKEVYTGFNDFNEKSAYDFIIIRTLSKSTNLFKSLVTNLNPIFLVRNVIRDLQDAGINTKYARSFVKNYARAIYHLANNTEYAQLYRAAGGFDSSIFEFAEGFTGKQSKGFAKLKTKNPVKKLGAAISNANLFVEQLPRFAEFISTIEAGGSVDQAILNAADVTTNFGRTGTLVRAFNRTVIPFLNPAFQGLSKLYRNFREPLREGDAKAIVKAYVSLIVKCVILGIAPMALNNLLYRDDEEYEDVRSTDKENNYLFKVGKTWIKIPKGRFVSVIAGLANRTQEEIEGDADWSNYFKNVMSQVTPVENFTRPIWQPFIDAANNKTWYGTDIESAQFESVRPRDRYDESTSSIAIAIGKAINYSPKKIHYLLDSYTGVIGDFILPATTKKAEKNFAISAFVFDPVTSNKLSGEFYKAYETAKFNKTDGDNTAIYQIKYFDEIKKAISEMYDEINEIQASDLSNAEKLQQVRVIRMLINTAYKTGIENYEDYTKAIESTSGLIDDSDSSGVKLRYAEITRRFYGAEKAFEVYSTSTAKSMATYHALGIDYEKLYSFYFSTLNIENDTDRNGKVVEGSKRKKIIAQINTLKATREEKILMIYAKGYAVKDGDIRGVTADSAKTILLRYLNSATGLTTAQKKDLASKCGFELNKSGRFVLKS